MNAMASETGILSSFRKIKWAVAGLLASGMIAVSGVSAMAQPVVTGGLVNVTITNLLNNNQVTVTVPIQAAANICGVSVAALNADLVNSPGPVSCASNPSQGTSVTVSRP